MKIPGVFASPKESGIYTHMELAYALHLIEASNIKNGPGVEGAYL